MEKEYKIRRRLEKKVVEEYESYEVNNPAFDAKYYKKLVRDYGIDEASYYLDEHPQMLEKIKTIETIEENYVLEYEVKCEHCGIKIWKPRKSKYCGDSCRVMAYRKRKKGEPNKRKTSTKRKKKTSNEQKA